MIKLLSKPKLAIDSMLLSSYFSNCPIHENDNTWIITDAIHDSNTAAKGFLTVSENTGTSVINTTNR